MTTVKLVSDAHALQSMRASDFDACSAYGEAVDNSLQANANVIRVEFSYESRRGGAKPIKYVAFGDDGDGMDADTLQRCLQLGFSSRFNDRGGIGRFGSASLLPRSTNANVSKCTQRPLEENGSSRTSTSTISHPVNRKEFQRLNQATCQRSW